MAFLASELMSFATQFSKRNIRWVGVLAFMGLAYVIGFTSATHNLDYPTYEAYYNVMPNWPVNQWHFEKGYSYLSVYACRLGLSYRAFRVLICFVAICILYVGVRRFSKNTALFAGIYGGTVFLLDVTQVRNFLMISIVVLSISFLQELNVKNILISVVLILIAGQFHSLGYLFILVILLRLIPFNIVNKVSLWLVAVAITIIALINVVGVKKLLNVLSSLVGIFSSRSNIVEKVSQQYGDGSALIRYVAVAVSAVAAFLMVWFLYQLIVESCDEATVAKYQVIFCAVLTSVIMLPTLSFADDYSRIPRSTFLFVILAICVYFDILPKLKIYRMQSLIVSMMVLVCGMNGFSQLYSWGTAFRGSLMYLIQLR